MFIRFCVCRRERERERKRRGGKERGEAGNVFMNKLYDKFLIESNEKNNGKTTTTITVDKGESKTSHSEPARSKQGKKIESKSYTTTTTTTSGERQNSVHVSLATDQFIHILQVLCVCRNIVYLLNINHTHHMQRQRRQSSGSEKKNHQSLSTL